MLTGRPSERRRCGSLPSGNLTWAKMTPLQQRPHSKQSSLADGPNWAVEPFKAPEVKLDRGFVQIPRLNLTLRGQKVSG